MRLKNTGSIRNDPDKLADLLQREAYAHVKGTQSDNPEAQKFEVYARGNDARDTIVVLTLSDGAAIMFKAITVEGLIGYTDGGGI